MTASATKSQPAIPPYPAFLVGVTGYMDLAPEDIQPLKRRVAAILRFLRHGPGEPGSPNDFLTPLLDALVPEGADPKLGGVYEQALRKWPRLEGVPGLRDTPIVVLTALAPGADSIVAEVVMELAEEERAKAADAERRGGFFVKAALPFPPELYPDSSTFVKKPGSGDAGDTARQDEFKRLVERIRPEDCFMVDMRDDRGKPTDQVYEELKTVIQGDARRKERHDRQYAAGEYMAVYCHVLLALWDGRDEETDSGTAAVVRARLSGPRFGILPNTAELALPHGGPVLHLLTRRKEKNCPDLQTKKNCLPLLPELRFLHPYVFARKHARLTPPQPRDPACDVIAPGQHLDAELQTRQLNMLTRIAENLEEFNRQPAPGEKKEHDELEKMLGKVEYKVGRATAEEAALQVEFGEFRDRLKASHGDFYQGLRLIASVRRKASRGSQAFGTKYLYTLGALFSLTLLATVLLHVFAHGEAKASGGWALEVGTRVRIAAGGFAFAFVIVALVVYYFEARRRRVHERAHDNRALAEGLRVQFFWCLAGLGRSASASYMQRQRSELDWMRAAVRSVSFPYRRWIEWFDAMQPGDRREALRCVFQTWIVGEHRYYRHKSKENERNLHFMHRLGALLAMGGVLSFVLNWLAVCSQSVKYYLMTLPGSFAVVGAVLCYVSFPGRQQKKEDSDSTWRTPQGGSWMGFDPLVQRIPPDIRRFLSLFPLAIGMALTTAGACYLLAPLKPWLPEPEHLLLIASGALLVGAALSVAWPEKRLYSETAYQYNTMASLFAHARQRVAAELERLDREDRGSKELDEQIGRIQDFLHALGREALDENAEWLLLHRARPLEPMMPG